MAQKTPNEWLEWLIERVNGLHYVRELGNGYKNGDYIDDGGKHPLFVRVDKDGFILGPDKHALVGLDNFKFDSRKPLSTKNLQESVSGILTALDDPTGESESLGQNRVVDAKNTIEAVIQKFESWKDNPLQELSLPGYCLLSVEPDSAQIYHDVLHSQKDKQPFEIEELVKSIASEIGEYLTWFGSDERTLSKPKVKGVI